MCMYYRTTEAADESKCVFAYAEERHTDENRKRESVCILCVDHSVCRRDNKERSVCNEGNFESTLCESQRAGDRPASVFVSVFVQRKCACVCQTCFHQQLKSSQQRFQSGSSAVR